MVTVLAIVLMPVLGVVGVAVAVAVARTQKLVLVLVVLVVPVVLAPVLVHVPKHVLVRVAFLCVSVLTSLL